MVFDNLELNPYSTKLRKSFKNSQTTIFNRSGNIVKLFLDDMCGLGEASPLMPYSSESTVELSWAFEELKVALKNQSNYSKNDMFALFELYAKDYPSLHFALDCALYDILAQKEKVSFSKYLNLTSLNQVKLSSLYIDKLNQSSKVVKIKFGRYNLDQELNLLYSLMGKCNKDIQFRIDANKAYTIDQFIYLSDQLKSIDIEYIEEPLLDLNIQNLKTIKNNSSIPIAIDESIFQSNYRELVELNLVDYAVIKPSLYGGIKSINELVHYFKKHNVQVVLSSGLHTNVGNLANIHLASSMELDNYHGLNNYAFFDKMEVPYDCDDCMVELDGMIGIGVCGD
tara:strand:+ start:1714 stop:2733 length:1020 start_codon:yes stop_codon:yes gene_type:complete